ncbi:MAG: DUF4870 domain-containing protein [Candidatus Cybelea sp.]
MLLVAFSTTLVLGFISLMLAIVAQGATFKLAVGHATTIGTVMHFKRLLASDGPLLRPRGCCLPVSESQGHHHHASEVPPEQRLAAVFTHIAGVIFLFVPALIVWLRTRRDPVDSWLAHQAKEALNFQYTLTAAFYVCAMAGWAAPPLAFWLFAIVLAFDLPFSLTAAVKSAFGERYVYPVKLTIVR